jgi:hypothetical protein
MFYSFVKKIDLFGYNIRLNFKQKGDIYQTFPGGLFSILIISLILFQTFTHFKDMFTYGSDFIQSNETIANYTEIGELNAVKIGAVPFYGINTIIP